MTDFDYHIEQRQLLTGNWKMSISSRGVLYIYYSK
jgi:hypothetical protein